MSMEKGICVAWNWDKSMLLLDEILTIFCLVFPACAAAVCLWAYRPPGLVSNIPSNTMLENVQFPSALVTED